MADIIPNQPTPESTATAINGATLNGVVPESSQKPYTGETGTVTPERVQEASGDLPKWFQKLSDGYKSNPQITKFENEEKLAEAYINASKLIGKRVQDLSPEEVRTFLTPEELQQMAGAKNLPTSIEDYKLPTQEELIDPRVKDVLKKKGMELQLNPNQLEELIEFQDSIQKTQHIERQAAWQNEVQQAYGRAYDRNLAMANRALSEFGDAKMIAELQATGMADNPRLVEFCKRVGEAMLQDRIPNTGGKSQGGDAASAIKNEIRTLQADPKFYASWAKQDKAAVSKINSLYDRLHEVEDKVSGQAY